MTTTTQALTGTKAIEYAASHGCLLGKHADPTEPAREGLSVAEAREVAKVDPSLVYLTVAG